jgi:hypothetical protein
MLDMSCEHPEAVVLNDEEYYEHFMNCFDDQVRMFVLRNMRKQADQGYQCWNEQHDIIVDAAVNAARERGRF